MNNGWRATTPLALACAAGLGRSDAIADHTTAGGMLFDRPGIIDWAATLR
jgi:hypothetical protein